MLVMLLLPVAGLFAQESIALSWPLTSPDRVMVISDKAQTGFGAGTAVDKVVFDRTYGAIAGGWNTEELNPAAFYEYRIIPSEGLSLSFDEFRLDISVSSGEMNAVVKSSIDGFSNQVQQLGQPVFFYTRNPQTLTLPANLVVNYPDTLRIRVYGWGATSPTTEFNNRNVTVEGMVTDEFVPVQEPIAQQVPEGIEPVPSEGQDPWMAPLADTVFNTPGTFSWTCPAGVTCIKVECWGGGGGGGADNNNFVSAGAGGGGGGAYARLDSYPVIPGNTYTIVVGAAGSAGTGNGNGGGGGASYFVSTGVLNAAGGSGGIGGNNGAGGAGGAIGATGNAKYSGGNGRQGYASGLYYYGGGGGGSAGTGSNGNNATTWIGATAVIGGGPGGNGNRNGDGSAPSSGPGGGGGGGEARNTSPYQGNGGAGYAGQVKITYIGLFNLTPAGVYCEGGYSINLSGSEVGVYYQLYRDATALGSAVYGTGSSLSFGTHSDFGTYYIVGNLSYSSCTRIMNDSLIINPAPTITLTSPPETENQSVCVNSPITNIVYVIGGGATVADVTGLPAGVTWSMTGTTLTITGSPTVTGTFNYTVTTTDALEPCPEATDNGTITVNERPTAGITPDPAVVCSSSSLQLYGNPAGGSGTYTHKWTGSGSAYLSSTLIENPVFSGAPAGMYGLTYTVTDANGCSGSDFITVTVNASPTASITPDPVVVCSGGSINLFGNPIGGSGIYTTHLWTGTGAAFLNNVNIPNPIFSGALSGSYNLVYTVTDNRGCSGSDAVTVTVNTVAGGTIASDQTICQNGDPLAFTSLLPGSGTGVITYQWKRSVAPFTDWTLIAGATSEIYDPNPPPPFTQTVKYQRVTYSTLSGLVCEAISNILTVTVQGIATPGEIGNNQIICYGDVPVPLVSVVNGSGSPDTPVITYLWQQSTDGGTTWNTISGESGPTYAPPSVVQTTLYKRITISTLNGTSCYSIATNIVTITVQDNLTPPFVEDNQTICYNTIPDELTRTDASGGSGNFTYQWQSSVDNITWIDITGESGITYQPPALTETTYYRVFVTDAECGTTISNVVIITVYPAVVAPAICCSQVVCGGNDPAPLTGVPASGGSGIFTYMWQLSIDGSDPWTNTGVTNPYSYNPPSLSSFYRLVAYNTCDTLSSNIIQIALSDDFSGNIIEAGIPSAPLCPADTFTYKITSVPLDPTFSNVIRFIWSADPAYISPSSGGPVGETQIGGFLDLVFKASIFFTVYNNTADTVTTTISVTPGVYESVPDPFGPLICNLTPVTFDVTILPYQILCPANMVGVADPNTCAAKIINIPNPVMVGGCDMNNLTWSLTGATTGNSPPTGIHYLNSYFFNVGITVFTYTASDSHGNTSSCSFTITVTDTQNPTITCPSNIIVSNAPGLCGAIVNFTAPVINDNCPGATLLQTAGLPSGSFFPIGITTNTFKVTDASGNSASCSFTVTVNDDEDPTITCPANQTRTSDPGCTYTVSSTEFDPLSFGDNCAGSAISYVLSGATTGIGSTSLSGKVFNADVTTVTWTVTDLSGNHTACTFTVTVLPQTASIMLTSAPGTDAQTVCMGTPIINITYLIGNGGTGATVTGLPTGVTGSYDIFSHVFTISGTPSVIGTFSYTVTTSGTCVAASANGSITVNPLPTVTASASDNSVCAGTAFNLFSSSSSFNSSIILSEGFESAAVNDTTGPNGWTTSRNNVGGTIQNSRWTVRPDMYYYNSTGVTFSSNDDSKFYLSNSHSQGSGTTKTLTILRSPAFSTEGYSNLSLDFFHYFQAIASVNDTARVQVSTNGVTWITVAYYTTTQGASQNFAHPTISLDSYIGNPTFYVRFRYYSNARARYWAVDNVTITGTPALVPVINWTSDPPGFTSDVANPSGVSTSVTTTYTVTYTNPVTNCSGSASTIVTVYPLPDASITADYCDSSGYIKLTANPSGCIYLWNTGETDQTIYIDEVGINSVLVTNINGCSEIAYLDVSNELVTNGNFSLGNVGFSTSYGYVADNPVLFDELWPEGLYGVGPDARNYHTNFWGHDHTTGSGTGNDMFMIVNGSPMDPAITVWQQTVTVQTNTDYYFSAWAMSLNKVEPYAELRFEVNGVQVGTTAVLEEGPGDYSEVDPSNWVRFYSTPFWNSGSATTAVIRIINLQPALGGNDFGLDDISFGTLDPPRIFINPEANGGEALCEGDTLYLEANVFGGVPPFSYHWTGPAGFNSTLEDPIVPDVTYANQGWYYLMVGDDSGCPSDVQDSTYLSVQNAPSCLITGNSGPLCPNSTGNTYTGPPGMSSYYWTIQGNGMIYTLETEPSVSVMAGWFCDSTFTLTLAISNGDGCDSICSMIVPVDDADNPQITCPPFTEITVPVNLGDQYQHIGTDWDAIATDNCNIYSLNAMLDFEGTLSGPYYTLNGVIFNQGTTTVTWTATDGCGNTASCTFNVIVIGTADIAVEKECPASIIPGNEIVYELTVANFGPALAPEINLTDIVPADIPDPEFSTDGGTTWNDWTGSLMIYDLPVGDDIVILLRGDVDCVISGDLSNTAEVELFTLTDPDESNNSSTCITAINDPPPSFTLFETEASFCANNIIDGVYNPFWDPLIVPEYDDITYPRPEYYLLTAASELFDLDPVENNYNDNCCIDEALILHWRIDFTPTPDPSTIDHNLINWPPITNQTGQPSLYGDIEFPSDGVNFTDVNHYLYYWLEDCNGNISTEKMVTITVIPRPNIIKTTP